MYQIAAVYLIALVYAVVRYVAFNPENASIVPVFVVNKAVAMAMAICFLMGIVCQRRAERRSAQSPDAVRWFRAGT